MPSLIDFSKPIYGSPTTQSVRDNFQIAQTEITDLQAITQQGPFVPLKGGIMTGFLELSADPRGNFEAATKQYVDSIAFGSSGTISEAPKDGMFYARGGGTSTGINNDWKTNPLFTSILIGADSATKYFQIGYDAIYNFYNFVTDGSDTFRYNRATKVLDFVFAGAVAANFSGSAITFSKPLTLSGDPTVALGAATKGYVDAKTYPYLPLIGGTVTGNVTVTSPDYHLTLNSAVGASNYITGQKGLQTRWIINLGNNTAESGSNVGSDLVISRYSDGQGNLDIGGYTFRIVRSSGTISTVGNLRFDFDPANTGQVTIFGRDANPTTAIADILSIRSRSDVSSSVIAAYGPTYTAPYANAVFIGNDVTSKYWSFRQDGHAYFPGDLFTVGALRPNGALYFQVNQGISFSPTSIEPRIGFDPTGSGYFFVDVSKATGARMAYDGASKTWSWSTASYSGIMTLVGPGGHFWAAGNITAGAALTVGDSVQINSNYGIRFQAFNPTDYYAFAMNTANWAFNFYYNSGFNGFLLRSFDFGQYTGFHRTALDGNTAILGIWWGSDASAFAYWAFQWSDRKLKWNIKPSSNNAIDTVNKLNIISCDTKWVAEDSEEIHWDYAIIADEIQDIIPGAYIKAPVTGSVGDEAPAKSYDSIREMPLIATALKAIQELSQRLVILENKQHG